MASAAAPASSVSAPSRHDSDPAVAKDDDTSSFRTIPKADASLDARAAVAQPVAAKGSRRKLLLGTLALVALIGGGVYLWMG
jgi:hypothetical protein